MRRTSLPSSPHILRRAPFAFGLLRQVFSTGSKKARALLPNRLFPVVRIPFHGQIVNSSRSEIRIVPAKNFTFPRVTLFGLSKLCSIRGLPISRPHHCQLLAQCEGATRNVNKLDEFTDSHAAHTRAKNRYDFPSGVIGNPVPCHKPSRSSPRSLAAHARECSRVPKNQGSGTLPVSLRARPRRYCRQGEARAVPTAGTVQLAQDSEPQLQPVGGTGGTVRAGTGRRSGVSGGWGACVRVCAANSGVST